MSDVVRALMEKDGKFVYPVNDVDSVIGLRDALNLDIGNPIILRNVMDHAFEQWENGDLVFSWGTDGCFWPDVNPKLWVPGRHLVFGSPDATFINSYPELEGLRNHYGIFTVYSSQPFMGEEFTWSDTTQRERTNVAKLEILPFAASPLGIWWMSGTSMNFDVFYQEYTETWHGNSTVIKALLIKPIMITSSMMSRGLVSGDHIRNQTIRGNNIQNSTITGIHIASNTITASRIANNTITAVQINHVDQLGADVIIGWGARRGEAPNTVIALGRDSVANNVVSIAVGWEASAASTRSIAMGANAANADGTDGAVAIGSFARNTGNNIPRGISIGSDSNTTAAGAVALGNRASSTHSQSAIIVPNEGAAARATNGTNRVLLGFTDITPAGFAAFSNVSDKRDKRDVSPLKYDALEFINAIEPVQYRMDFRSDYVRYVEITGMEFDCLDEYSKLHEVVEEDVCCYRGTDIEWIPNEMYFSEEGKYATKFLCKYRKSEEDAKKVYIKTNAYRSLSDDEKKDMPGQITRKRKTKFLRVQVEPDGTKAGKRHHNGFLAQQVQEAAQKMGFDCPAVEHLAHNKDENGVALGDDLYSMKYTELLAPMVAAIQQLTARIKELEAKQK